MDQKWSCFLLVCIKTISEKEDIAPSILAYKAAASCSFSSASRLRAWAAEYLNSVKPRTVESYKANIKQHIKPAVGALQLSELTAVDVQRGSITT